jgi:uncharacterized damage-inducible protein DinB
MWKMLFALALLLLTVPVALAAQTPAPSAQPAPGNTEALLELWVETSQKIGEMAQDFPEDKYDYKPVPEVRTFAEQLLHIAADNYLFLKAAQGEKPGEEELPRARYQTKADVAAVVKKSFDDVAAYLRMQGDAGLAKPFKSPWSGRMRNQVAWWSFALQHAGEHYGQLVVYYRNNHMVPPASRPRGGSGN